MTKVRVYYDKSGNILSIENRPDGKYLSENVINEKAPSARSKKSFEGIPLEKDDEAKLAALKNAKWLVVDSEEIGGDAWDDFEVKGKKLAKKKKASGSMEAGTKRPTRGGTK